MSRIYFTYDNKTREGFDTYHPDTRKLGANFVEEIAGEFVLEKVPDLVDFIEHCYGVLKPEGKAIFAAPFHNSHQAWTDPRNIRALSNTSLNFANKDWREQNGQPDLCSADFVVNCDFAMDLLVSQRAEDVKQFWLHRYNNVVQSVLFTLTKK